MSNTTVPIIDGSKKYHRIRPPISGAAHTQQPLNGMPYYSGLKSDALRILRKSARQRTEQVRKLLLSDIVINCKKLVNCLDSQISTSAYCSAKILIKCFTLSLCIYVN